MAKNEAEPTGSAAETELEAVLPLGPQPLPELIEYRRIEDVATIKALADPLRLKIMRALGRNADEAPRIMTVKQLAEEIGEPTTKLYRHMKQLLAVDLIQVAELRLVGGIVEQHYRAAQKALSVNPGPQSRGRDMAGLSEDLFGFADAAIEDFFSRFESALRAGRTHVSSQENLENPPYIRSVGAICDFRMPRERAAEFAERFHALVKELGEVPNTRDEDAVHVNLMGVFYATEHDDALDG
jgi:DNA-binding transcriptional ArsR family regulator